MVLKKIVAAAAAVVLTMGTFAIVPEEYVDLGGFAITAEAATLSAPSGFSCTTTSTTITLKWKEVSGADAYRVYMYNSSTSKWEKYKNVSGTTCKINDLFKNTTYYFKVAALEKSGKSYTEGTQSNKVKITTKANDIPTAPSSSYTGLYGGADGKAYCFNNGKLATGWQKFDGYTYYFDKTNYSAITGWLTIGDNDYYFSSTGKMYKNTTITINGKKYTFNSDGKLNGTRPAYDRLSPDGQKLVDGVAKYIEQFKDPTSVKIISANEYQRYDSNFADYYGYFLKISATNGFGGRGIDTYYLVTDITVYNHSKYATFAFSRGFNKSTYSSHDGNPPGLDKFHSFKDELDLINEAVSDKLSEMGY